MLVSLNISIHKSGYYSRKNAIHILYTTLRIHTNTYNEKIHLFYFTVNF